VTGSSSEIVYGPKRDWDKSNRRLASIDKAHNLIGYEPKMDFNQGLKNVHNWLTTNHDNIVNSVGPSAGLW